MMKKRMLSIALVLALVVSCTSALAETMVFPSALKQVEQEAYLSNTAITEVLLPTGLQAIGNNAFKGCSNLVKAIIPGSTAIGTDAFANCSKAMLIRCAPNSPAHTYAKSKGIDYNANTKYRALVIGQIYSGADTLYGTTNDAIAMEKCLTQQSVFAETSFSVTRKSNLTAEGIVDAVFSTFASANANDVSLFYYSGHGVYYPGTGYHGALVGSDDYIITADILRQMLDYIPGRKIVIIDACHSGYMIGKSFDGEIKLFSEEETTNSIGVTGSTDGSDAQPEGIDDVEVIEMADGDEFCDGFTNSFIDAFASKARANLATSGYYVITAASSSQSSWEGLISGKRMGFFTYYLTYGCGWNGAANNAVGSIPADTNRDGVVTLNEAYSYAKTNSAKKASQTAQVYPTSSYFGLLRK